MLIKLSPWTAMPCIILRSCSLSWSKMVSAFWFMPETLVRSAVFFVLFGFMNHYLDFRYHVQLYCKCFSCAEGRVCIIDSLTLGQRTMGWKSRNTIRWRIQEGQTPSCQYYQYRSTDRRGSHRRWFWYHGRKHFVCHHLGRRVCYFLTRLLEWYWAWIFLDIWYLMINLWVLRCGLAFISSQSNVSKF